MGVLSVGVAVTSSVHLLAQLNLTDAFSDVGGTRFITGFTMIVHMFFAELFVGFALAAPVLQAWGARTGSPRMDRLAHSMARFNVLTFSAGATFAVLFVVLLIGLYPRVTTSLFTHFFYFIALAMLSMGLALWGMYSYYYKWDRYSVLKKKRHIALGFTMGFFIVYAMSSVGSYERLVGEGGSTPTSNLLYINLAMVVALFVLSNVAMYLGAGRHPDLAGRRPIQFFTLVAAAAGLLSLFANFDHGTPLFWIRYIAILVMVLATMGAFVTYLRGRMRFRYGSPGVAYRIVLLSLGIIAAATALNMGFMKSNSRVPYTVYNQPEFTVEAEQPPSGFGR